MSFISFNLKPNGPEASATLAGAFLYWGKRLNSFEIRLDQIRRIVFAARLFIIFALMVVSFGYFLWHLILQAGIETVYHVYFWTSPHPALLLFWVGVLVILYLLSLGIRGADSVRPVLRRAYSREGGVSAMAPTSFSEIKQFSRNTRFDIAKSFSKLTLNALENAYREAHKQKHEEVVAGHLLFSLLNDVSIKVLLGRMGVMKQSIAEPLDRYLSKLSLRKEALGTALNEEFFEIVFEAYHYAYKNRRERVTPVSLFVSAVAHDPVLQEIFYALEIDQKALENVAAWMMISEQLHERYVRSREAARHRRKGGMNKAMTAQATPELDRFSHDFTESARIGSLPLMIDREKELAEIFRIFEGGGKSVVLVGQHGVGKDAIVEGVAMRMIEEEVPAALKDKRMVVLSISNLIAGVSPAEAQERLLIVLNQVARAGNILLVVPDIHQMVGVSLGEGTDLSDAFAGELSKGYFLCLATTGENNYREFIEKNTIGRALEKVEVKEMESDMAIQVLESKVGMIEYEQKVFFSYDALKKAVELSARYMHDRFLPEKAIEVVREAAQKVRTERGERQMVRGEDVAVIVSGKTNIPVTQVTQAESEKLLGLEERLHERVIGQAEAVKAIAGALRRARVELRDNKRPIANFLFLGPTGVGKTELAKTVAATYFGDEEKMVRLDMSEYQNKDSVARLIGAAGERAGGILTEAIRRQPFTVLLLDELEKAHPDILNIFLQVMDDGRLTDNAGQVIDFTNAILIATSNAGTQVIQDEVKAGTPLDKIKQKLIDTTLKEYYRPEFLNRFDGVIVFKPLTMDEISQITWLMIGKIQKQLEKKGIDFDVEDAAAEELARAGFDPVFGARPLKRVIQERVQDALANFLLTQKIGRRDKVVLKVGGQLEIEKAREL